VALADRLACSLESAHVFDVRALASTCPHDGAPLLAIYDAPVLDRAAVATRPASMWRYREVLPIAGDAAPVTLGEGATPLVPCTRLADDLRCDAPLYVKDESQNPTASFKSRGMSAAVTRAYALGVRSFVTPSAGNAGGALAAYGARAGAEVTIFFPRDTPPTLIEESRAFGARVELVDGLIDLAGKRAAAFAQEMGAFNVATLREPYRIEGKKTMGYELVEELGDVPAAIVYPAGGGTGLIGMWKAFDELERAGWIGAERPRMFAVQATGCAPIVRAHARGDASAQPWVGGETRAWGLRVPAALGDRLMLRAIAQSGGDALAIEDGVMEADMRVLRSREGIDACEEGGATVSALRALIARGERFPGPVVLFNTASALKYAPRSVLA
jgi:threonine synthase